MNFAKTPHSFGNLSETFFERLIAFYERSLAGSRPMTELWSAMCRHYEQPLIDALTSKDVVAVKMLLGRLYDTGLPYGLDNCNSAYADLTTNQVQFAFQNQWRSQMMALAVGVGAVPVWSDILYGKVRPQEADGIIYQKMCDKLGLSLDCPKIGARIGMEMGSEFVPLKMFQYAWVIKTIKLLCPQPGNILEIGGGLGGFAQLSLELGVKRHVVVDLPVMIVMAAFFMAEKFGESAVWLDGEETGDWRVCYLLAEHSQMALEWQPYDVAVNMDGLPEYPIPTAHEYLKLIEAGLREHGHLVSVNHEMALANMDTNSAVVSDAVRLATSMIQVGRNFFPMREGYLEEIFKKVC